TARDVEIATLRRELADLQDRQDGTRATGASADPPGPPAGEEHRAGPAWLPAWQRPAGPGTGGEVGSGPVGEAGGSR
ncbi:MAG TPA: hypothetical protein VH642_10775, partial [Streptosporangiaceae bacterium]